jgi:tetratricopeptide (TPR) repeat protein
VHALTAKGHALLGLKKYGESIKYFDEALHIGPQMQEAHVFKGMALYFLGKYDEAMEIEAFRTEFSKRFKQELDKKQPQRKREE